MRAERRTYAGVRAKPELRLRAGAEAPPIFPPPRDRPLCRDACTALAAWRGRGDPRRSQRRRHGSRWVFGSSGPAWAALSNRRPGSAERARAEGDLRAGEGVGRAGVSWRPEVGGPGSTRRSSARLLPAPGPFPREGASGCEVSVRESGQVRARALEKAGLRRRPGESRIPNDLIY